MKQIELFFQSEKAKRSAVASFTTDIWTIFKRVQ